MSDSRGEMIFGDTSAGRVATCEIHDPETYDRVARSGTTGAAEAYRDGWWSSDDLPLLMRLFVANDELNLGLDGGAARIRGWLSSLLRFVMPNSRTRARSHIAAHYDLSNELFAQFLDPTMTYSAALFHSPHESLEAAQINKVERLCRLARLNDRDHLLEIGTGWGFLACYAARNFGCRVTTTTISERQYEWAARRIAEWGLEDRVTLLKEDYRNLSGRFDKIISVEMVEAVGSEHLTTYIRKCSDLLSSDGLFVLQAITVADRHYQRVRREIDFIKKHIFPGSCLVSVGSLAATLARSSDLTIHSIDDLTLHYAETLRRWRKTFLSRRDKIIDLGFDESFIRLWDFYFAYCEAGFEERHIGDIHMVCRKPGARPEDNL